MLPADEKEKLKRGFAEGEASLLLEGLTPTAFGLSLRDRVLSGEISVDQAEAALSDHYIPTASRRA
jgi:hypothetical protein